MKDWVPPSSPPVLLALPSTARQRSSPSTEPAEACAGAQDRPSADVRSNFASLYCLSNPSGGALHGCAACLACACARAGGPRQQPCSPCAPPRAAPPPRRPPRRCGTQQAHSHASTFESPSPAGSSTREGARGARRRCHEAERCRALRGVPGAGAACVAREPRPVARLAHAQAKQ